MKSKLKYIPFICLLIYLAACEKSHLNDNIPRSVVNLSQYAVQNVQLYTFDSVYVDTLYATDAGMNISSNIAIAISVDSLYIDRLNNTTGTDYVALSAQAYTVDEADGNLNATNRPLACAVKLRPRAINALSRNIDYVLPLK